MEGLEGETGARKRACFRAVIPSPERGMQMSEIRAIKDT